MTEPGNEVSDTTAQRTTARGAIATLGVTTPATGGNSNSGRGGFRGSGLRIEGLC